MGQIRVGRGRELASNTNPDSTDLKDRSRIAETLRGSKDDKELVGKNITLCVETLDRSRCRDAQNSAKIICCSFSEIESMQQVILNPILNAVEAMRSQPTRARSVASVKEGATGVLVTIRDSGIVLGRVASSVRATLPVSISAAPGAVS